MAIGAYSSAIITGMMPTYDQFLPLNGCQCHHRSYCCPYLWSTPTLRLKVTTLPLYLGMAEIIRIIIVNGGELANGAAGLTGILPY